jgi:hypothetical protein
VQIIPYLSNGTKYLFNVNCCELSEMFKIKIHGLSHNILTVQTIILNGEKCYGAKCLWGGISLGELSMGRNVPGVNCPWGELSMGKLSMGRKDCGVKCHGASCSWGEF